MDLNNLKIEGETNKKKKMKNTSREQNSRKLNETSDKERIKKIRIPKLEKDLGGKQEKVTMAYFRGMAKNYIRDRLQRLTQDRKDLEKLRKISSGNEKIVEYIDNRITSIVEEQKKLRDKLKDLQKGKTIYLETDVEERTVFGPDFKKIIGPGILLLIMGLTLIYIGSEYGLLIAYGILFITGLVSALVMSILGMF